MKSPFVRSRRLFPFVALGVALTGELVSAPPAKPGRPGAKAPDAAPLALEGYDANAPVFVNAPAAAPAAPPKVNLPAPAAPGEHPRLLFTTRELTEFKASLEKSERGQAALKSLMGIAAGNAKSAPQFPSVPDTVANRAGSQHSKLANAAQTMGLAYALSGDQKYAQAVKAILLGYAQRYAGYPRHSGRNASDSAKVTFQRLSEAMWLIPQLEGYDYIYNSGVLSDAEKKAIEDGLIRPCILEIRRQQPAAEAAARAKKDPAWREKSPAPAEQGRYANWVNFYSTATMMAGAVMNDKDMIDLAAADFRSAIATGIGADGMWGEGAINYQLFAMGVMSPGFETAAHQGIDLWGALGGRFKMLFDSPLRYAYPDGTMPGINDSSRGRIGSAGTLVYDYGFLRYGEPQYGGVINDSPRQLHASEGLYQPARFFDPMPEPPAPKTTSTLFGSLGFGILRDETKYALLQYGPHGGVHGHFSKLNLVLYGSAAGAKGDELGGEPRMHKYDDPLHPEWSKVSLAHNTMTVDEANQAAGEGKILLFDDTPELKVMRAEISRAYPGVLLDRTVVTTRDAVIDIYTGRSATAHTWDRTFRYNGPLAALAKAPAPTQPLGAKDGYQHFKVAQRMPGTDGWSGTWETKVGPFQATVAGAAGQEIVLGLGPDQDQLALARQKGTTASFAAAYQLKSWGNGVSAIKWLPEAKNVSTCVVLQESGMRLLIFVGNGGAWESGGWKSDARVLVVQETKDTRRVLLAGGTFADSGKGRVQLPAAGNGLAEGNATALRAVSTWKP